MIEQLHQLATCGRPWAEQRAQWALQMMSQWKRGEITFSEYQELMQDLVRSDRLDEEADDLETKNFLVSCIMIGAKLA